MRYEIQVRLLVLLCLILLLIVIAQCARVAEQSEMTTKFELSATIPPNAMRLGIAPDGLGIWSVVETVIQEEIAADLTQTTQITRSEIAINLTAEQALQRMVARMRLLVALPQAVQEVA